MPEEQFFQISDAEKKERRKRRIEIRMAIALAVFVVICTWLQLSFYELDSWLFIVLFNINSLLMLVILFLVARNVVKLIIERRRKVFGARIRSRMVLIFVMLTLIPTLLLFLAANRVIGTSVDYWFTSQTENALQAALDVGHSFYANAADRLHQRSEILIADARKQGLSWKDPAGQRLLDDTQKNFDFSMVALTNEGGETLCRFGPAAFVPLWDAIRTRVNWQHAAEQGFNSLLWTDRRGDYVIGVTAIHRGKDGFLVTADSIGQGLMAKLNGISRGFEEYARLKQFKKPLKVSLQLILGVLAMLTLFGSIWYGFRLSKEITAPLLALAEGTNRIARGDLNFRLEDKGADELAQLVESFNMMAEELSDNRESLTRANALLARQNATMDDRRRYIEAVLDNITTGVVTLNASGRVLTINKAACAAFRTSLNALYDRTPAEFLPPDYVPAFNDMLRALGDNPERHWQRQVDFVMAGRIWKLVINAVALSGKDGIQSYIVVIEDITELEKMQRMAAWREVARRIAHEIKNPLTPIKLSAQRLARKFGPGVQDPVFTQCTELIVKQTERLQEMVQEFSAFAKLPEINLKPGRLEPIIDELVTLFRTSHGHIAWVASLDPNLPPLLMDPEALHRALLNLMTNAAEAIDGLGDVKDDSRPKEVRISARYDAARKTVRIQIADTGPGLTPEEHAHLFEPYFSRKKGGTGLGLAIVKSIVADHRGSIRVASSAEGTAMIVELPQCPPVASADRFPSFHAVHPTDSHPAP